jgi:hypothetical protein
MFAFTMPVAGALLLSVLALTEPAYYNKLTCRPPASWTGPAAR